MATSVYYRHYSDAQDSARPAHYVHSWFSSVENEAKSYRLVQSWLTGAESEAAAYKAHRFTALALRAFPLIPMVFPPMGTAISYASAINNGIEGIYNLFNSCKSPLQYLVTVKDIFKFAVELTCLVRADLKTSLFVHHTIDIAEKTVSCCRNPQLDRIVEVASSCLYLISFYPFDREVSYKFVLASMMGQGMLSLYRAGRVGIDRRAAAQDKVLECAIHVMTALGRFTEAYFCYQHIQKMKQALQNQHLFIWVRTADQQKHLLPQIAPEIETLRKVYGEKALTIVMPEPEEQQQSATLLARELHSPAVSAPGLQDYIEIKKPKRPKGDQKTPENKAIYDEKKALYRASEKGYMAGNRLLQAFKNYPFNPSVLPVFVTSLFAAEKTAVCIDSEIFTTFKEGDSLSLTVVGFDGQKFTAWEKLKV
jgi:hypothetical protein